MIPGYKDFKNLLKEKKIKMKNPKFDKTIQKFDLFQIPVDNINNEQILEYIKESKVITIDKYANNNNQYFICCLKSQIIIIDQSEKTIIEAIYSTNKVHNLFNISVLFKNSDQHDFEEEIDNFIKEFGIYTKSKDIKKFWNIISPSIAAYLIKQGYLKTYKDRINKFIKNAFDSENQINEFKMNDFIELRVIYNTCSLVALYYHIEKEKLFVIKTFSNSKLKMREMNNYMKIKYPFIPKYYGKILDSPNSFVIEYINGQSLYNINKKELDFNQKVTIIIELLHTFQYLHNKDFIYRDLKPNNLIIDNNYHIVLIDFDRMINIKEKIKNEDGYFTRYFNSEFVDPKINENEYIPSFENDIYSIGKIIEFIFTDNSDSINNDKNECLILDIATRCFKIDLNDRPSLSDIIMNLENFDNKFILMNIIEKIVTNQNDAIAQANLGYIYSKGKYIKRDINKAIYFYSLAADQNDAIAQYNLGNIYHKGEYIKQDINKAIYYYTLAADQDDADAQYNLGNIYYEGKYITQNINKAIHYYTLAANQNIADAQNNLGLIYYEGKYIKQDINKAIYYLSLSANQNNTSAYTILGVIYSEGKYIIRDINKAIYYLSYAANQNDSSAQIILGNIYYEGKYISQEINKAIYYYSLAANQNDTVAQNNLGYIYLEGNYIKRDINKSIYYFSLAANRNDPSAQNNLANIYSEGKYIKQDINKAIYYYSLAANQNIAYSQYMLGKYYLDGIYVNKKINKAVYYLYLAAKQGNGEAQFILGVVYSEGKNVKRNINEAIHYYKEASSINHSQAKNNLAIIYKSGFYVEKNLWYAIELLKEAVKLNDYLSMYNLSHLYFYENGINSNIETIIDLLFKSCFYPSFGLLCIVLIKKYHVITKEIIIKELNSHGFINKEEKLLSDYIYFYIHFYKLEYKINYENHYYLYKNFDYMYDTNFTYIPSYLLMKDHEKEIQAKRKNLKNIDENFYQGFGILI